MGSSKHLFSAAGFLLSGSSSLYNFVLFFCKPSLRFVMYTNSCCSVSCVSSVDLSSSLSQLNSSIESFSWLSVFRVGLTCSSSCLDFCFLQWVSFLYSLIPCEALSLEHHSELPNTSSQFQSLHFWS